MAETITVPTPVGTVTVVFTDRSDGDLRPVPLALSDGSPADDASEQAALDQRRRAIVEAPWTWLRQVHGASVVNAASAGDHAGVSADGAMTTMSGCPLAVATADCAPVVLVAEAGFAVVHAGWRGLVEGVIAEAAAQLRATAGSPMTTLLGPCISAAAYEFGADDLRTVANLLGDGVRGVTEWGTPALDLRAGVAGACEQAGWPHPAGSVPCTSDDRWYSHRARGDEGRQATVAWLTGAVR